MSELLESQARGLLQVLLDDSPEVSLVVDRATGHIVEAHGGCQALLGLSAESLVGQPVESLAPSDTSEAPHVLAFHPRQLESPAAFAEVAVAAAQGHAITSLRVFHFDPPGGKPLALLRLLDGAEHHRLSVELRRVHADLQRAFRTLRTHEVALESARRAASLHIFAAGLAHEVNNLLGPSLSNAATLRDCATELAEAWPRNLERPPALDDVDGATGDLTKALERMSVIIRSLSELEHVPRVQKTDLAVVLREATKSRAGCRLSGATSLFLETDPHLVRKILDRLLDNARRGLLAGGQHGVHLEDRGSDAVIEVHNEGNGLPPEVRDRLFDPFFTTRKPGEGLGLGLFLSRRAANRLGGDISYVDERLGVVRFRVVLPKATPRTAGPAVTYEGFRSG